MPANTPIMVHITQVQRDRIDAVRPATTSRNAWVREAVDEKLARDQSVSRATFVRREELA